MRILLNLKQCLFAVVLLGLLFAQKYDISIWGIKVGTATISRDSESEATLNLQTLDYITNLYPIDIEYNAKFNPADYSAIEACKNSKQGDNKIEYTVDYFDNNYAVYNGKDTLRINPKTYSFLSLLYKIIESSIDSIDTKWFDLENEGILYKARPLWNDTTTLVINNNEYICDHYRFDLKVTDDSSKLFDETDYFNDLFFDINSIRQIWVENWQKQKRLIKIALKNTLINLEMVIAD